jgi:hypothetical protein
MSGDVIMRRNKASKRGRLLPLLAACIVGYLIGAWQVAALREVGHGSAAEAVALRFPQEWNAPATTTLAAVRISRPDADLFRPVPMIPPSQSQASVEERAEQSAATAADRMQTASLEAAAPLPAKTVGLAPRPSPAAPKAPAAAHPSAASRAGYILDDAQIVSIKARLHLTPDQERMWPAVEAALRNMAYKRSQQAAARGGARNVQAAAVDPEAVEGLKSAAVPLIMSFSSEQKDEVRSLVHVMGLDQLASQF